MTTCANCSLDAKYQYSPAPSYTIFYCFRHVPRFLKTQVDSGELAIVVEDMPTKKKATPIVEKPVEEVVEEDTPTEE